MKQVPLRERKRAETMRRIQTVALDLFDEKGFDKVTVEEIADAATVSPSSVYRYFGTKEALIVRDDQDVAVLTLLSSLLTRMDVLEAVDAALDAVEPADFAEVLDLHKRRLAYFSVPSVRAALLLETSAIAQEAAEILTRPDALVRRSPFEAGVLAHALVAGLLYAIEEWARRGGQDDITTLCREALAMIRQAAGAPGVEA